MNIFLQALNRPADAFRSGKGAAAWTLVGATVLLNSVFEPLLSHFCGVNAPRLDAVRMLRVTLFGALTYVVICAALWLLCRAFGSRAGFGEHLRAWGCTYYPTALCAIVVAVTETFFYVFWNGTVWGMVFNFVFVGILIWKAILYFIYLIDFADLRGWRLIGCAVSAGVIIILLALLDAYLGVKTPVL